jgi:di/tricarboxylate transporter
MAARAPASVFAPFAPRDGGSPAAGATRRFRWVVDAAMPLALILLASVAVLVPAGLSASGRIALWAFAVAVILWSTTALNAAYVSLGAVMLLIVAGGQPQEALYGSLASDVVWLMIGAFVLGGAVQQTGLAGRLTDVVVSRAQRRRRLLAAVGRARRALRGHPLDVGAGRP